MNGWYIKFLKLKYVVACLVIAAAFAITFSLIRLAYAERGYEAIGGEYAPLVFSFIVAAWIVQGFGELEMKYRQKLLEKRHPSRGVDYVGKVHEVREEIKRPEFYIARVREGVCVEVERNFRIITLPEADAKENGQQRAVCAITFIERK